MRLVAEEEEEEEEEGKPGRARVRAKRLLPLLGYAPWRQSHCC